MKLNQSSSEINRVRRNTSPEVLRRIDEQIERNIQFYSAQSKDVISRRIHELQEEWSIERWLELNVATIGLSTVILALTNNRKWALVTCGALGMFLMHALQGFDPPLPLLRSLAADPAPSGEIDREMYALKALRGDFASIPENFDGRERSEPAKRAADAVSRG